MTIPAVVKEFGSPAEIQKIEVVEAVDAARAAVDTDQALIRAAEAYGLPLVSEDKKILMAARRLGLPYFNTLMIMNFLIFKKAITPQTYAG